MKTSENKHLPGASAVRTGDRVAPRRPQASGMVFPAVVFAPRGLSVPSEMARQQQQQQQQ